MLIGKISKIAATGPFNSSPVPYPIKMACTRSCGLSTSLRAIPELSARYGFKEGSDKRETSPDYCRILNAPMPEGQRLIVCKDELQIIYQRLQGKQWRSESFHQFINSRLKELLP